CGQVARWLSYSAQNAQFVAPTCCSRSSHRNTLRLLKEQSYVAEGTGGKDGADEPLRVAKALPPRPLVRHSLAPLHVPISPASPQPPQRRSSPPSIERSTLKSPKAPSFAPPSLVGSPPAAPPRASAPKAPVPPRDWGTLPGIGP